MRQLIVGPPCAKAGADPAARIPAMPAPAVPMNFLRSIFPPPLLEAWRGEPTSIARDRHAIEEDGTAMFRAAHDRIGTDGDDALEHVEQVARDRDLFHRMADLAALDPEPGRAARVVAGHVVHALAHELGHDEPASHLLHQPGEI